MFDYIKPGVCSVMETNKKVDSETNKCRSGIGSLIAVASCTERDKTRS